MPDDLTELDAQLLALAAAIMEAEAPDVPVLPGRVWLEDSLFRAMQTYAGTRQGEPDDDILAACERIGRMKARGYAARSRVA